MPKFQIGEDAKLTQKVIMSYSGIETVPAGTVVRIIGLPGSFPKRLHHIAKNPESLYEIEVDGYRSIFGNGIWAGEEALQKLLGSWDEIEKTTGFKPSKKKEVNHEQTAERMGRVPCNYN